MPDYSSAKIILKNGEAPEDYEERRKKASQKDYENLISFRTYKTWLLAMITKNKQEDLHYSEEVAKAFVAYRNADKKLSTGRKNKLENLLSAKTKKNFLEVLTELVKDFDADNSVLLKELKTKVYLMTSEDFGYFIVLLKFDYAYQGKN
jgi:hypothetical protein